MGGSFAMLLGMEVDYIKVHGRSLDFLLVERPEFGVSTEGMVYMFELSSVLCTCKH